MSGVDIDANDLAMQIDRNIPPLILDVRSAVEFNAGHVPGARHMPFWAVPFRANELGARDRTIVVYCGHGPRAQLAAGTLRARGFTNVRLLCHHMAGWRRAGLPIDRG